VSPKVIVARAIRLEVDTKSNEMFLVFKIIDETFKNKVRDNWDKNLPLQVVEIDLK
jgi:hypothetical protein